MRHVPDPPMPLFEQAREPHSGPGGPEKQPPSRPPVPFPPAPVVDPGVRMSDVPRLSDQCELVLSWLKAGERIDQEIAASRARIWRLAARIHDLRAAGHAIRGETLPGEKFMTYWIESQEKQA